MKRTKEQKGITLIALIITIVVLLILAAVAISSITNDGILQYAQNAADSWNKAAQDEAGMLHNYLAYLDPCGTNGHDWGEWVTITAAADCRTKTDAIDERTCSECGTKDTRVTEYYKHNVRYGNHSDICLDCESYCDGTLTDDIFEIEGDDINHDYIYECTRCNCEPYEASFFSHIYYNGICSYCGHACGHSDTSKEYEKDESGNIYVTCYSCYETVLIQPCTDGHTWAPATEYPYHGQQCEICFTGDACFNADLYGYGEPYGEGMCIKGNYCSNCNQWVEGDAVESECWYGPDGKCTACGR